MKKWLAYCKEDGNLLFEAIGNRGDISSNENVKLSETTRRLGNEIFCLDLNHPDNTKHYAIRERQIQWLEKKK